MSVRSLDSPEGIIRAAIRDSIEVKANVLEQHVPTVARVADIVVATFRAGGKVVLFGNGGSAADAQHVAAELIGCFNRPRDVLPAVALTTDSSILTAVGNDLAFDQAFSRQVQALVQKTDVAVGISTSGNSSNVLNGVIAAGEKGAITVGFTGLRGGKLKDLVDVAFCAPAESTPRIQEAHITVWHAICEFVERELFR